MVKISQILEGVRTGAHGFLIGAGTVLLVFAILIAITQLVMADEAVRTYPARLGEQDRSLNYPIETTEHLVEYHSGVIIDSTAEVTALPCDTSNTYLLYMLHDIAKQIAKNPELGYIYKDAILTIHGAWCTK